MNINIGYATIPAIHVEDPVGRTKQGWALPGGVKTTCIDQARRAAVLIDQAITAAIIARQSRQ